MFRACLPSQVLYLELRHKPTNLDMSLQASAAQWQSEAGSMDVAPVPRSFRDRVKAAVHWWLEWDWLTLEHLVDWLLGRECAPVKWGTEH